MDIDSLWEFSDPALSEERFRDALDKAEGDVRLELQTQIARTYSLRKQFDKAHTLLDEVEPQLNKSIAKANIRYLLERGRAYNSSGKRDTAKQYFINAWEKAQQPELDTLAVDAAHMVAITHSGTKDGIAWNKKGLALAETSSNPKAKGLLPALLNNIAWDYSDMGQNEDALEYFKKAARAWEDKTHSNHRRTHIAKWSVAKCLRTLDRHEEALTILFYLEEHMDEPKGYVYEELAENFLVQNDLERATNYFQKAYEILKQDTWLVKNESERISRLASFAEQTS